MSTTLLAELAKFLFSLLGYLRLPASHRSHGRLNPADYAATLRQAALAETSAAQVSHLPRCDDDDIHVDMDDIVTFLLSAATGAAPAVGYQFVMDQANATTAQVTADMQLLTNQALPGDLDLTAHGYLDGELTGLLYQPLSNQFVTDRSGVGPFTPTQLQSKAQGGQADLAFTAVTLGTGERIALDRNTDGILNGAAAPANYGIATPGCSGPPKLVGNSEPFIGNGQFGYALENAQANSFGILAMALGQASIPILGVQLMIDPTTAVLIAMASDDLGNTNHAFPIPADAALIGATIYTQGLWLDWCGAELWASSDGVSATIQP